MLSFKSAFYSPLLSSSGGLPGGSDGKESACIAETQVWSPGQKDPLEKWMLLTPVFLPGISHGQRSLVGYSPCGHKESDLTEWLIFSLFIADWSRQKLRLSVRGFRSISPLSIGQPQYQPTIEACVMGSRKVIIEYWVDVPVLYIRSLLIISFVYSNVYSEVKWSCSVMSDPLRTHGL